MFTTQRLVWLPNNPNVNEEKQKEKNLNTFAKNVTSI